VKFFLTTDYTDFTDLFWPQRGTLLRIKLRRAGKSTRVQGQWLVLILPQADRNLKSGQPLFAEEQYVGKVNDSIAGEVGALAVAAVRPQPMPRQI